MEYSQRVELLNQFDDLEAKLVYPVANKYGTVLEGRAKIYQALFGMLSVVSLVSLSPVQNVFKNSALVSSVLLGCMVLKVYLLKLE